MTPITLTKPGTLAPVSITNPTELATLPLTFTAQRQCKNKEVMAAIIDALSDKSRADHHIALIFSNAFHHNYLPELNQIIKNITTLHGPDSVTISTRIMKLLADDSIKLIRNNDGTVHMHRPAAHRCYPERHAEISRCATRFLCGDVAKLLCDFDDEIEISDKNQTEIASIFRSGDATAKGLIIAAASSQGRIGWLNRLFTRFQFNNWTLDLSFVELSNLNLTGIELRYANLKGANFENSCLKRANLQRANLTCTNLNGANLDQAALNDADLSHARLIAASLRMTRLDGTRFTRTLLLCATVDTVDKANLLPNSIYQFAKIETDIFPLKESLPHFNSALNVIVSDAPDHPGLQDTIKRDPVVITTSEKNRLLENRLTLNDNGDGTFRVKNPLSLNKSSERERLIDDALKKTLPKELTKIISSYEEDIDIATASEGLLLTILKSNDQQAKGLLIAAASRQVQIATLNALFEKLRMEKVTLDLSGVDLSNLSLHGINLNEANLTGAIMHGCDLFKASISHAILVGANLNGASLDSASFFRSDLTGARLIGANLSNAGLSRSRLVRAVLKFADLTNADLGGGTNLIGAYLDYAILENTDLSNADLSIASLTNAKIHRTHLNMANLSNANVSHAELVDTSLMTANLSYADFSNATLHTVTLALNPILTGTVWSGASFRQIRSDPATMKKMPLRMWMHCK